MSNFQARNKTSETSNNKMKDELINVQRKKIKHDYYFSFPCRRLYFLIKTSILLLCCILKQFFQFFICDNKNVKENVYECIILNVFMPICCFDWYKKLLKITERKNAVFRNVKPLLTSVLRGFSIKRFQDVYETQNSYIIWITCKLIYINVCDKSMQIFLYFYFQSLTIFKNLFMFVGDFLVLHQSHLEFCLCLQCTEELTCRAKGTEVSEHLI